jgi:hypothetical protein
MGHFGTFYIQFEFQIQFECCVEIRGFGRCYIPYRVWFALCRVATTLIFLIAVTGNFASYLTFLPSSTRPTWHYDIQKLTTAASMFYGVITFVPFFAWLVITRLVGALGVTLVYCLSIWGYALSSFVPISLLCIIPSEVLRYLFCSMGFACSCAFLLRQIHPLVPQGHPYGYALFGGIILSQLGLAIANKLYFFEYTLQK